MREVGAQFLVTGEVLGERPMSQKRDDLLTVEKESGLKGLIVRPLSARLLEETMPEKEGWVELESKVDTEKRVVFARVDHFSQFAVVAPAPPLINWLLIGEIIAVALAIGMGVYLIRRTKG